MASASTKDGNTVKTVLNTIKEHVSVFALNTVDLVSNAVKTIKPQKTAKVQAEISPPVFEDVTKPKQDFKSSKANTLRTTLPSGMVIDGTSENGTQIALQTAAVGANFKGATPEPVYHINVTSKLDPHIKKVFTEAEDDKVVRNVQITLGENVNFTLRPSQIKIFLDAAKSLDEALIEVIQVKNDPVKDNANDATVQETPVKSFESAPQAEQRVPA